MTENRRDIQMIARLAYRQLTDVERASFLAPYIDKILLSLTDAGFKSAQSYAKATLESRGESAKDAPGVEPVTTGTRSSLDAEWDKAFKDATESLRKGVEL